MERIDLRLQMEQEQEYICYLLDQQTFMIFKNKITIYTNPNYYTIS